MRKETIELYQFSELSEDAKQKALLRFNDINLDFFGSDWSEYCEQIEITLQSYDLWHGLIKIDFIYSAQDTAESIIEQTGKKSEFYKLAKKFLKFDRQANCIYNNFFSDSIMEKIEDLTEDKSEEFKNDIQNLILEQMKEDYEYQQSEDAVKETIEANEYEFTKAGDLWLK